MPEFDRLRGGGYRGAYGAGFSMEYAHKLFAPFQRLHGREEFEGTGIGLSIVQRIVSKHSGKAGAESVGGQGATFCFTL